MKIIKYILVLMLLYAKYLNSQALRSQRNFPRNGNSFVTTWKLGNPDLSKDNQITICADANEYSYDYNVDWGDGTWDKNITNSITHAYKKSGTFTVSIWGKYPHIYFNNSGDKNKLSFRGYCNQSHQ